MENVAHWSTKARCEGLDPEIFHPGRGSNTTIQAKSICSMCPVAVECLDHALDINNRVSEGIWGGLSERDRQQFKKLVAADPNWGVWKCKRCLFLHIMYEGEEVCKKCEISLQQKKLGSR